MSLNIDLRLHRAAVVLAEELNFRRASARLHVSQSGLTRQIHELESGLGVRLFARDNKHVSVLPAGMAFVEGARLALMHSERAINLARATASEHSSSISVGRSPFTDSGLILELLSTELPSHTPVHVRIESAFAPQLVHAVAEGSLDLAIVTGVPAEDGILRRALKSTRLQVAISVTHPSASKAVLSLRDLDGNCWALLAKQYHPWIYEAIFRVATEYGMTSPEVQHVITASEGYTLAADHGCVSFVTEYGAAVEEKRGVVLKNLEDKGLEFTTSLLMRADETSEVVVQFAEAYVSTHADPVYEESR